MKRLVLMLCGAFFAAATATGALAADLPRKAPAYSGGYGFSWSGFYVGINGGYGFGKSDWSSAATAGSTKPKGGLAGVTLGYNMQTGVWVWGLEGDIDASWMKGTDTSGTGVCSGLGCTTKNSWLATGRGRIGYAWDRWLPYLTAGAAFGDVKMTREATATSTTKTKIGWTAGVGVEYAFMGPWSAKLEYLYADLGKSSCGAATCGIDTDVTYKANIVRAGVNYRF